MEGERLKTALNTSLDENRKILGFDVLKLSLALIVVVTHVIQGYYGTDSVPYFISVHWLSKFVIPCFFMMSGYLLFRSMELTQINMRAIIKYTSKIFKLYIIWSVIYLPINIYGWLTNELSFTADMIVYIRNFLFASNIEHLWYLPALIIAVLIVAVALKSKMKLKVLLAISFPLYLLGIIGDNNLVKQIIPIAGDVFDAYSSVFVTTRNGLFYGVFFTALGVYCAKTKARTSKVWLIVVFLGSFAAMLGEGFLLRSVNMLVFTVPASYALFRLVETAALKGKPEFYETLRSYSSLIYYSHMVFVIAVLLALQLSGILINGVYLVFGIPLMTIVFSAIVLNLQKYRYLRWLRKLY